MPVSVITAIFWFGDRSTVSPSSWQSSRLTRCNTQQSLFTYKNDNETAVWLRKIINKNINKEIKIVKCHHEYDRYRARKKKKKKENMFEDSPVTSSVEIKFSHRRHGISDDDCMRTGSIAAPSGVWNATSGRVNNYSRLSQSTVWSAVTMRTSSPLVIISV